MPWILRSRWILGVILVAAWEPEPQPSSVIEALFGDEVLALTTRDFVEARIRWVAGELCARGGRS